LGKEKVAHQKTLGERWSSILEGQGLEVLQREEATSDYRKKKPYQFIVSMNGGRYISKTKAEARQAG